MEKSSHAKIFLAAYHWPSDSDGDCVTYARSKGYGIIHPNGSDLDVSFMAEGDCFVHLSQVVTVG